MAEVLAITNQKGGVGKTTTTLNLGAGLARKGKRVLFIDMDPQCSLSYIMSGNCKGATVVDLLMQSKSVQEVIQHVKEGDLIAASPQLSSMDMLLNQTGKEFRLREALQPVMSMYDYIVIDSPPTLGVLTINILTAANSVIIPALADIFSLQGIGQLYASINAVRNYCNPSIRIAGILLIRHTDRFILNREMRHMLEDTAKRIGSRVFATTIREAVAIRESSARSSSIFEYAPKSKQAKDYAAFTDEFLRIEQSMKGAK